MDIVGQKSLQQVFEEFGSSYSLSWSEDKSFLTLPLIMNKDLVETAETFLGELFHLWISYLATAKLLHRENLPFIEKFNNVKRLRPKQAVYGVARHNCQVSPAPYIGVGLSYYIIKLNILSINLVKKNNAYQRYAL